MNSTTKRSIFGVTFIAAIAGISHASEPQAQSPIARPVIAAQPKLPAYTPDGKKSGKAPPPAEVQRLPISDAAHEIIRRRDTPSNEPPASRSLRLAGCMACHTSLDGISVRTFSHHVDQRQSYYRRFGAGPVEGSAEYASVQAPAERSGTDELQRSIEASGESVRPAGSMSAEMAREKWEAARKREAAEHGDADELKSDWERTLTCIASGKFDLALPPLKAHIAAQIKEISAAREAAMAPKDSKESVKATPPETTPGPTGEKAAPAKSAAIASPDLDDTKRLLALVLLSAGQPDAASALVREMYRQDPRLARRPLPCSDVGISDRQRHEGFSASMTFANRAKTGSSWLMAAMLAQADGRLPLARTLVDRGAVAGLDRDIADAFAVALDEAIETERVARGAKPQSTQQPKRRAESTMNQTPPPPAAKSPK